jgi:enamine deaminase RidA (YjgF/YER057c/UK114 family)
MAITRLNPERLHQTAGYAHVTIVDSGQLAILAGQCPLDRDAQLVGPGDILAQVDQVVANAAEALEAAGTRAENVVRSVIYVVSEDSGVLSSVWDRLTGSGIGPAFTTASTLLGVAALGYRGQLVEVQLTAAMS